MPKFISYDGTDKNGIRAEVTVMTGTGRIKGIVGRGKANEDGSFRNVEVEFDPDNPLLKRKVYGLLDTNATELWTYIQTAHAEERTVSYRIESQRRNGVERETPIGELNATEQIRRILASIDGVFSHEAKTNPAEDPDGENPSALNQAPQAYPSIHGGAGGGGSVSPAEALAALAAARQAGLPQGAVEALMGHAMAAGASVADVLAAGFVNGQTPVQPSVVSGSVAVEDKPWSLWNSDGRINYGSYAVSRAAEAEQFALDHLIEIYTPPKSKPIDVTDEIIAQSAGLALELLTLADKVQVAAIGGGRPDRMKNSYTRALALVTDAVGKRYPAPVGGNDEAQQEWAGSIVAEASERLYGLGEVAMGRVPKSLADREDVKVSAPVVENREPERTAAPAPERAPEPARQAERVRVVDTPKSGMDGLLEGFSGTVVSDTPTSTFSFGTHPVEGDADFVAPDPDLIGRLRAICEKAGVAGETRNVSDWIERVSGVRSARKIHAPVLSAFCDHYEKEGPAQVRAEVMGAAS